jgi:hypothetical protein
MSGKKIKIDEHKAGVLNAEQRLSVFFMPDGKPAPAVMTPEEVSEFLRLDRSGLRCLKYWRDTNQIAGIRLGKRLRFTLSEVMRFLEQKEEKSRHNGYEGQRS